MYTLRVYAVCVGLIFLIGMVLFTGFAVLLVFKDGCFILVAMATKLLLRVSRSAARSMHPLTLARKI